MRASYSPPRSLRDALPQWCIWVVFSTFGLALGLALVALLGSRYSLMVLVLPGIAIGSAQWVFLRSLPRAHHWILATSLGYPLLAFGLFAGILIYGFATIPLFGGSPDYALAPWSFVLPTLFSIPLGLIQLVFLRRHFNRPGTWIPATVAGWFLASLLILPAELSDPAASPIVALAATIPAAVTGASLLSLKPKEAIRISEGFATR